MKILVVNAGSSTYKLSLYDLYNQEPISPLWQGLLDWGKEKHKLYIRSSTFKGDKAERTLENVEIKDGLKILVNSLWEGDDQIIEGFHQIDRIGHRVVHGGSQFDQPTVINAQVKDAIRQLISLAPLHNPANLQGIEEMEQLFPSVLQIAVFDTSFHLSMPEFIKTYPIPWKWKEHGIQRYGFHGISHQYCAEQIDRLLKQDIATLKIINCHLGNGCSLCAIQNGKSYETTMGFTPLEGLMMGTRCGSIDPGILLYLLQEQQFSPQELDQILNFNSGLKGIAGESDMRKLLEKSKQERVQLALRMFIHRLKTSIGALTISLEGFNVLSFTGGIGENAACIREEVCQGLECLNLAIHQEKNRFCEPDAEITAPTSVIRVFVLHTQEEWMIAKSCFIID